MKPLGLGRNEPSKSEVVKLTVIGYVRIHNFTDAEEHIGVEFFIFEETSHYVFIIMLVHRTDFRVHRHQESTVLSAHLPLPEPSVD